MIKTVNENQSELIKGIITLHCDGMPIELDPTYSKGNFYKDGVVKEPTFKFDLNPQTEDTVQASAENLPIDSGSIRSIIFDPPFIVGHTKQEPTGIMGNRFKSFKYIRDLWEFYDRCLIEFYRILKPGGILIFKCQDTVSSGKQHWSHIHIANEASAVGFYMKDIFILVAKNRIIGHNHQNQQHARKYHSYFLVFKI